MSDGNKGMLGHTTRSGLMVFLLLASASSVGCLTATEVSLFRVYPVTLNSGAAVRLGDAGVVFRVTDLADESIEITFVGGGRQQARVAPGGSTSLASYAELEVISIDAERRSANAKVWVRTDGTLPKDFVTVQR